MIRTAVVSLAVAAGVSSAQTFVGGFNFPNNGFADALTGSSGSWSTSGGSLSSVLTDIDAGTFAFSFGTADFATLAFTNNVALNLAGADLVIFELGVDDVIDVTINGVRAGYLTSSTGFTAGGFNLNAATIDLSAHGVASGGSISSLTLHGGNQGSGGGTVASYSLVGALYVPAPGAAALLGLGGLASIRRRR